MTDEIVNTVNSKQKYVEDIDGSIYVEGITLWYLVRKQMNLIVTCLRS